MGSKIYTELRANAELERSAFIPRYFSMSFI